MEKKEQKLNKKDIPLFFIVGRPRSGTTLLRTLFDAHPNVKVGLECPYIFPLYEKYGEKEVWTENELEFFYYDLMEQSFWHFYKFKELQIDFEGLKNEILSCTGETSLQHLIKLIYPHYISDFPKGEILACGDKNPDYSLKIKKLFGLFNEAKFIFITRDYRDQLLSVKKAEFGKKNRKDSRVLFLWRKTYLDISEVRASYPDSFYSLRYEDFVLQPKHYFEEMCEFIGIPYCSEVFDFHKHKDEVGFYPEEIMKKYQKSLFRPIDSSKVYGWKNKMNENEIKLADNIVGKVAEIAGYERKYKRVDVFIRARFLIRSKLLKPVFKLLKSK